MIQKGAQGLESLSKSAGTIGEMARNMQSFIGDKGKLGWKGDATNRDQMVAEIGKSIEAGIRQGVSFDSNFTDKVSQSEAYKVGLNSGNSLVRTAEANFSKAREAAHMSAESYQEAQSYREMAARTYGNGITIAQDNTNALVQDNPELTMSELNAGQGGTYNAAIRAGVNSQDRLKAGAEIQAGDLMTFPLKIDLKTIRKPLINTSLIKFHPELGRHLEMFKPKLIRPV
ncbi:protein TraG [Neisseria gonorrhoeae]|uniref:Protein TraG n=1 Tax=Neisseria gonorrhoeae TaxID=485 RepID=A0A378VYG0_NEIGO|nr:protein TraG [Neisseria gonorrhoeae]